MTSDAVISTIQIVSVCIALATALISLVADLKRDCRQADGVASWWGGLTAAGKFLFVLASISGLCAISLELMKMRQMATVKQEQEQLTNRLLSEIEKTRNSFTYAHLDAHFEIPASVISKDVRKLLTSPALVSTSASLEVQSSWQGSMSIETFLALMKTDKLLKGKVRFEQNLPESSGGYQIVDLRADFMRAKEVTLIYLPLEKRYVVNILDIPCNLIVKSRTMATVDELQGSKCYLFEFFLPRYLEVLTLTTNVGSVAEIQFPQLTPKNLRQHERLDDDDIVRGPGNVEILN